MSLNHVPETELDTGNREMKWSLPILKVLSLLGDPHKAKITTQYENAIVTQKGTADKFYWH